MGNYCHSGETKQDDDNASEKSDTPTILKNAVEHSNSENHDQSNTQDKISKAKEAIYLEETLSTENVLKKSGPLTKSPTLENLPPLPSFLHLLYGNPNMISKIQKEPKIVFYVLSPSSGQSIEKDVFLKCFEYVSRKYQCSDFEVYLCDLHEDINSDKSTLWKGNKPCILGSEGHDQAANCLFTISKYINSCYLVPILMLNDSIGEVLLPLSFEIQDFLNLLKKVSEMYPNEKKLIEKWYKLDENSKPECYRLQIKNNDSQMKELEEVLHILTEVLPVELLDLYFTTIVEQEINHTILFNQDVAKRCLWIQNTSDRQCAVATNTLEKEILRRISNLRLELSMHLSDNQVFGSNFLTSVQKDQLDLALQTSLCNIIENIIDDYNCKVKVPNCSNGVDRRLLFELDNTDRFIKYLIQNRANFDILDDIKSFIKLGLKNLMIVEGQSGAGKTTLIAKIAENINVWKPNTLVVSRFCRTSYYKCTPLMLLRSIVEQLSVLIKNKPYQKYENDLQSVVSELKELLSSTNKHICFLLDDFHLTFKKEDIAWLSSIFTSYIKCIITLPTSEESTADMITQQDFHLVDVQKIEILKIKCSETQWKDIITHGVGDVNTTGLNVDLLVTWSTTEERILVKAKLLWWLAWLGITDLPEMSLKNLSYTVLEVIENMFGKDITSFLIPIINSSRSGLHESEIIQLIKAKCSENSHPVNARYLWGKFSWVIGSLLSNGKNMYFIDSVMRRAVKEKYESEIVLAHKTLFRFYSSQPDKYQFDSFERWNLQKFHDLPYQSSIIDSEHFNTSQYMTDLFWISSKLDSLGVCSFIEDTLLCKNKETSHIDLLCQMINKNFTSITVEAQQICSHMHQLIENDQSVECIDDLIKNNWISYLNGKSTLLKEKNISFDDNTESYSYDVTLSLNCPGNFVVVLSKEDEQLCVWDVEKCKKVRVLKNVHQPQSLCLVGDYCVAVLCNREIKLIDLDKGEHIITLKGVMNQKMPYFALHDLEHIVCLSRNRMYVNLMNLKSGDCITTFKAGEDRFLNSLLVSGDGRILVCGDETSKPFPLLVWNLTQRKLLYDLRIPHHDFVTALSAITYEGSYVAVVAKETVEPSPNFIVVYDLQSGTLFKKWKPTCNTVALSISQKNMCVIAGLEDAKILMWDLVTGNCRGTLIGHTAPVTLLKIDPSGKVLLSGDLECRDQSIRIWELNSGAHLATYTPKRNILACELSSDGRFIVLTFQGSSSVQTLEFYSTKSSNLPNSSTFGNKDFEGKVFDLKC